jgi:hypothetical protein
MSKMNSYALLINNEYITPFVYPSGGSYHEERMTAGLLSNPTIVKLDLSDIPDTNKYEVYVGEDLVGNLYYTTIEANVEPNPTTVNFALSNNPTVVYINSDEDELFFNKMIYDGEKFIHTEEKYF